MNEIFFIRHGMTDALAQEVMCGGDSDLAMNKAGIFHTREMAQKIGPTLTDIKHVFCSPLVRAVKTAAIYNEFLKKEISIIEDLREWRLGQWEGVSWQHLPSLFEYEGTPPGGEARAVFRARAVAAYKEISSMDGRKLIFGHGIFFHEISKLLSGTGHILKHDEVAVIKGEDINFTLTIIHKNDIYF